MTDVGEVTRPIFWSLVGVVAAVIFEEIGCDGDINDVTQFVNRNCITSLSSQC